MLGRSIIDIAAKNRFVTQAGSRQQADMVVFTGAVMGEEPRLDANESFFFLLFPLTSIRSSSRTRTR